MNAEKMNYQDNAATFHQGPKHESKKISEESGYKSIDQNEFEVCNNLRF